MFDLVICNHVLEHIPEDLVAMKEIFRFLKKNGVAITQIPIDITRVKTYEDPNVKSKKKRAELFGQYDHVRIYGKDFFDRLKRVGFSTKKIDFTKDLSKEEIKKFSINEGEVIPIGINAMAGEELTVSVTHKTTPADLKIYLEDAQEGTFTLINNEDFVLTPTCDLSGVGRFFIHTTADTLSDGEVNTSLLNAYKEVGNNYITIEGLATQATSTQVSLFNILGTKVMDATLDNTTNTQMISTNGLSTGIYVLKLVSGQDQLTKKLIIK